MEALDATHQQAALELPEQQATAEAAQPATALQATQMDAAPNVTRPAATPQVPEVSESKATEEKVEEKHGAVLKEAATPGAASETKVSASILTLPHPSRCHQGERIRLAHCLALVLDAFV
jgi:hypothetical protein